RSRARSWSGVAERSGSDASGGGFAMIAALRDTVSSAFSTDERRGNLVFRRFVRNFRLTRLAVEFSVSRPTPGGRGGRVGRGVDSALAGIRRSGWGFSRPEHWHGPKPRAMLTKPHHLPGGLSAWVEPAMAPLSPFVVEA